MRGKPYDYASPRSNGVTVLVISEAQWQDQVLTLAALYGWRVAHFRPAKTERGWRTAVQADGAGFPDLVLVRGGELIFAELKSQRGRVSTDQQAWLHALSQVAECVDEGREPPFVAVHVWRPADFPEVHARLAHGRRRIEPEYAIPLPTPPPAA